MVLRLDGQKPFGFQVNDSDSYTADTVYFYLVWYGRALKRIKISPFNRIVLLLTLPKELKHSDYIFSSYFRGKNICVYHRPKSTQWTSMFGQCWELRSVAHDKHLWSLLIYLCKSLRQGIIEKNTCSSWEFQKKNLASLRFQRRAFLSNGLNKV